MINHFFECLVPISKCNLHCEYCYVIQENRRNNKTPSLQNAVLKWKKAIREERIGKSFFSFCGYGETFLAGKDFLQIIYDTLECGHIVNITNNGTITDAIDYLIELPDEMQRRLMLSFSLHYDELAERNLLNLFANNVNKIRNSEISCFVQINLCDSYANKSSEIKEFCLEHFGCLPQVAVTRRENGTNFSIYTDGTVEDYVRIGNTYNSKLFEFTFNNFNVKRDEFCHAGEFSYKVDISTGDIQRCYFEGSFMNIYEDLDCRIPAKPIGKHCGLAYCVNSSHFLSLGNINDYATDSYVELRNRECGWIKNEVKEELSNRFVVKNCKKRLKDMVLKHKLVLYGAGTAAIEIVTYLKKIGVKPNVIYVSCKDGNDDYIEDVPIIQYSDETKSIIDVDTVMIIGIKNYNQILEIKNNIKDVVCEKIDYYDLFQLDDFLRL